MAYLLKLSQYERLVSLEAQLELSLNCTKVDDQINMNRHERHNASFSLAIHVWHFNIFVTILPELLTSW